MATGAIQEVEFCTRGLEQFEPLVGKDEVASVLERARRVRGTLNGRTIWNINSTAAGGGVAEMLRALLPYVRSTGIDIRWAVISGDPDFFRVTKRLHHALHGSLGDGSLFDDDAQKIYDTTTQRNAEDLRRRVQSGDVVILHDPQTAGLSQGLLDAGVHVIWRCHIGHDTANEEVDQGWQFLAPYLRNVLALVFTRMGYVPEILERERVAVITPSIDAFSPKNQELDDATVRAILVHVGLVQGPEGKGEPVFTRPNGRVSRIEHFADVMSLGPPPEWDVPLVTQVSRWDPLKDPIGVMLGFADLVHRGQSHGAHLVLAGPNVHAVADDPEGAAVFEDVIASWRNLPHEIRARVHLASLPMTDIDENAAIVNALQRHSSIVVQKSLQEGFGLTVTEAMWKSRPVVASAVGGIRDQIEHGEHGLLLDRPSDRREYAAALARLLGDPDDAARLGANARERVRSKFLGVQHLRRFADLVEKLWSLAESAERGTPAA